MTWSTDDGIYHRSPPGDFEPLVSVVTCLGSGPLHSFRVHLGHGDMATGVRGSLEEAKQAAERIAGRSGQ